MNVNTQKGHLEHGSLKYDIEFHLLLSSALRKRCLPQIIKVRIIHKCDIVDSTQNHHFLHKYPGRPKYFQLIRADPVKYHTGRWSIKRYWGKCYCSACLRRPITVVSNHHLCSRDLEAVDILYCHWSNWSRVKSRQRTFASRASLRNLEGCAVY